MGDNRSLTCPSAPPELGSSVLGVVARPSEIAYIVPATAVTAESLAALQRAGIDVENRIRFSCTCAEERCVQWEGDRCGLIDYAIERRQSSSPVEMLPRCGIRSSCRWFAQRGRAACSVCPDVIRRASTSSGGNDSS